MDPVSAISLAGNVLQFVSFATNIISTGRALNASVDGALAKNLEIEVVAKRLQDMNQRLLAYPPRIQGSEGQAGQKPCYEALGATVRACNDVAEQLLEALDQLKVSGLQRKRKTIQQALRNIWNQDKINNMVRRLEMHRNEVTEHLTMMAWADQSALQDSLDRINKDNQKFQTKIQVQYQITQAEIIKLLKSITKHQIDEDARLLTSSINSLNLQEENMRINQAILDSLYFPEIESRQHRIAEAHAQTFSWIFKKSAGAAINNSSHDFSSWLRTGAGVYWISGKAGCGKSTLMKYISHHNLTELHLNSWAGSCRLVVASFYFWNAGRLIQRSLLGLLQSLFYKILESCQDLIPHMFPWRYRVCRDSGMAGQLWTEREFLDALVILKSSKDSGIKFCFFIDGLDEYDGDQEWIVSFFKELAGLPHVKLCISSRPWIVFRDAFESLPTLRVQDLTSGDIKQYSESTLKSHPRFAKLCIQEPEEAPQLIKTISARASGVFLWVHLVVCSLKDGLSNGDRICDLQRRLDALPSDLNDLFLNMLNSIDDMYFEQAARFFMFALEAKEPLMLQTYSILDDEDPTFNIEVVSEPYSLETMEEICEDTQRRLSSRCMGLLEVHASLVNPVIADMVDLHGNMMYREVEYLHRTVHDFLKSSDIISKLDITPEKPWHRAQIIMQATTVQIKRLRKTSNESDNADGLYHLIDQAFLAFLRLGECGVSAFEGIIDHFDQCTAAYWESALVSINQQEGFNHWVEWYLNDVEVYPQASPDQFPLFACDYGMVRYTKLKLAKLPDYARALALQKYQQLANNIADKGDQLLVERMINILLEIDKDITSHPDSLEHRENELLSSSSNEYFGGQDYGLEQWSSTNDYTGTMKRSCEISEDDSSIERKAKRGHRSENCYEIERLFKREPRT